MFCSRLIPLAVIGLLQWQSTVCASLVSKSSAPLGQRNVEKRQVAGTVDSSVFVRRADHASAVAGGYVYIDGGQISYMDKGKYVYQYSDSLLAIDLSQDWRNSTVVIQSITKPGGVPNLNYPSLWYHEKENVLYSGFTGSTSSFGDSPSLPASLSLWAFKPDGTGSGSYTEVIKGDNTSAWGKLVRPDLAAQAYGPDNAYIIGGIQSGSSSSYLSGMVTFDMSAKSFKNNSFSGAGFMGDTIWRGPLQHVDAFGPNGMFVQMGGYDSLANNPVEFTNVSVFDPAQQIWYTQQTTGNPPSARQEHCTAGVISNNGTYEIFVYGGWGGDLGSTTIQFDDIHVLSLPAFRWFKANYTASHPRHAHTCEAVGGSQILTIGGADSNSQLQYGLGTDLQKSTFNSSVDPFKQGLAIFDMTTMQFADHYAAHPPAYEQSEPVKAYYATVPHSSWAPLTPGVATLLQSTHFTDTSSNNNNTGPSGPAPASASPSVTQTSHSDTGAIVGGVIGGVAALATIAAVIWFLIRRRNRRGAYAGVSTHTADNTGFYAPDKRGRGLHEMYQDQTGELTEMDDNSEMMRKKSGPVEAPNNARPAELEARGE